jgi:hypothetical protein
VCTRVFSGSRVSWSSLGLRSVVILLFCCFFFRLCRVCAELLFCLLVMSTSYGAYAATFESWSTCGGSLGAQKAPHCGPGCSVYGSKACGHKMASRRCLRAQLVWRGASRHSEHSVKASEHILALRWGFRSQLRLAHVRV